MTEASPATWADGAPATPSAALTRRIADDPATPLLTYYDRTSGERVEVSAVTFANWVAKAANLIRDGLGLEPGLRALVDLPVHWQSLAVAHAVWAMGGSIQLAADSPAPVDVAFTTAERATSAYDAADEVVVLALRPLGMPGDPVPAPALDFDREIRTFGDRFSGPPVDPAAAALRAGDGRWLTHREVVERAGRFAAPTGTGLPAGRLAVDATEVPHEVGPLIALLAMANGSGAVIGAQSFEPRTLEQEQAVLWDFDDVER